MEQAEKLCDYVCMINNGQKVLDGSLTDIKKNSGGNTIQIEMEGDGGFMKDIEGVESFNEFNNYIELKLLDTADPKLILKEVADRVSVRRFEIMEPSLYNIFIETAGVKPKDVEEIKGGADA